MTTMRQQDREPETSEREFCPQCYGSGSVRIMKRKVACTCRSRPDVFVRRTRS